jgi:hypothetical protein
VLLDSQVQSLVSAMASFQAPPLLSALTASSAHSTGSPMVHHFFNPHTGQL